LLGQYSDCAADGYSGRIADDQQVFECAGLSELSEHPAHIKSHRDTNEEAEVREEGRAWEEAMSDDALETVNRNLNIQNCQLMNENAALQGEGRGVQERV
jgi:hypothetical protein